MKTLILSLLFAAQITQASCTEPQAEISARVRRLHYTTDDNRQVDVCRFNVDEINYYRVHKSCALPKNVIQSRLIEAEMTSNDCPVTRNNEVFNGTVALVNGKLVVK